MMHPDRRGSNIGLLQTYQAYLESTQHEPLENDCEKSHTSPAKAEGDEPLLKRNSNNPNSASEKEFQLSIAVERNTTAVHTDEKLSLQLKRGGSLPIGRRPNLLKNQSDWVKLNLVKLLETGGLRLYSSVLLDYLNKYQLEPLLSKFKAVFLGGLIQRAKSSIGDQFGSSSQAKGALQERRRWPPRKTKRIAKLRNLKARTSRRRDANREDNEDLVKLIEDTLRREKYFRFERTKKRLAIVELNNKSDLVFKILCTVNGLVPTANWVKDWSEREKQIFWLFMRRMWSLSDSWLAELQDSCKFPTAPGGLCNGEIGTFSKHHHQIKKITKKLVKSMVVSENRKSSGGFVSLASILGGLRCEDALKQHVSFLLDAYFEIDEANNRYSMRNSGHLKKKDMIAILNLLGKHRHILGIYRGVRDKYLSRFTFTNEQLEYIHKQILEGIDIINNELTKGTLPRRGLRLDRRQIKILQRFHVTKSLATWRFCFDLVAVYLNLK